MVLLLKQLQGSWRHAVLDGEHSVMKKKSSPRTRLDGTLRARFQPRYSPWRRIRAHTPATQTPPRRPPPASWASTPTRDSPQNSPKIPQIRPQTLDKRASDVV
jgi:hypothetical protein